MSESNVVDYILDERKFLHDISTPIMVLRLTVENLKQAQGLSEKDAEKLDRALRASNALVEKVEARRSVVKDLQAKLEA